MRLLPGIALVLLASLGVARGAPAGAGGEGRPVAEWTILVYASGDNNLTYKIASRIKEMGEANLRDTVNVLVAADYCAGNRCNDPGDDDEKVLDPVFGKPVTSGTQFLRIQGDGRPATLLQQVPEQNFDEPAVLRGWVARAFAAYPARRHAVILHDHGGSWNGGFGGDQQEGTVRDTRAMQTSEIASAIRGGMRDAGLPEGTRLEFLALDACLMATAEVLWDFRDVTRIYIANAEVDSTEAFRSPIFSWLSIAPKATARQVAVMDVGDWDETHIAMQQPYEELLRARAAFDTERLPQFGTDMKALVDTMNRSRALDWTEVVRSRALAGPQYGMTDELMGSDYYDLGQLLRLLAQVRSDPAVAAAAGRAARSLRDMTIRTSMGSVRAAVGQSGLQVAMNRRESWGAETRSTYARLAWDREVGWSKVLDTLDRGGPEGTPRFQAVARAAPVPGGATLQVTPTSDGAFEVLVYVVLPDAGGAFHRHGGVWREPVTKGSTSTFTWDGRLLALVGPDGKTVPVNAEPLVHVNGQEPPLYRMLLYLKQKGRAGYLEDEKGKRQDVWGLVDSSHRLMSLLLVDDGLWHIRAPHQFEEKYLLVPVLPAAEGGAAMLGKPMAFVGADPPTTRLETVSGPWQFQVIVRDVWGNEASKLIPAPL